MTWETSTLLWLQNNIVNEWLTPIMKFCTQMGNGGLIWILITIVLLLFPKTRKYGFISALALVINVVICNVCLKPLIARPRPFTVTEINLLIPAPGGFSFPSGHTSSSFAAATAIYFWHKKIGIAALIFAALVAFSRMYFFVHYPTDVLCGLIVGIGSAFAAKYIVEFYYKKKAVSTSGKA